MTATTTTTTTTTANASVQVCARNETAAAAGKDVPWKEVNAVFGGQEDNVKHADDETTSTTPQYRHLEFDFDDLNNSEEADNNGDTAITLRTVAAKGDSSGLAVWTCSQILSAYLCEHAHHVQGRHVLELGAGLGLCGIVAHKLGAAHVTLTDGDVEVLRNLRYNVQQNKRRGNHKDTVTCPQLVWGQNLSTFQQNVSVVQQHDVILATDVFYAAHLVQPLWKTIHTLLTANGRFWLAFCPHAVSADVVLEAASSWGFTWSCPNIMQTEEDDDSVNNNEDEECFDDFVPNSHDFSYHVFCFKRIAQQ